MIWKKKQKKKWKNETLEKHLLLQLCLLPIYLYSLLWEKKIVMDQYENEIKSFYLASCMGVEMHMIM